MPARTRFRLSRTVVAALVVIVAGCRPTQSPLVQGQPARDRRPIYAEAALPAPGEALPAFVFPRHAGPGAVSATTLAGTPALIALWSSHCPFQGPWVAAFDTVARVARVRGARVVILADDPPGATLDSALRRVGFLDVATDIGVAAGRLKDRFDRSADAPERQTMRVEFVLPSFLLVDSRGHVVRRAFGPADFGSALDSLLRAGPAE